MPTVSIITAAYAPSAGFLAETAASVFKQQLPDGWNLEWVVQEDGERPVLAEHFASMPDVKYEANERQLGIAGTRNLALERATGGLLRVLDSDDILLPNALATLIPHFERWPIHWAVGQADDLMTDGRRVPWPSAIDSGLVPAGLVNEWAIERGGNWPIHCAGLMLRTDTVRAMGGWAGAPYDEDIVMFAALSEMCLGYNDHEVIWLYRQHPKQITRTAVWRQKSEVGRRIALQRINAVRSLRVAVATDSLPTLDMAGSRSVSLSPPEKDRGKDDYL